MLWSHLAGVLLCIFPVSHMTYIVLAGTLLNVFAIKMF